MDLRQMAFFVAVYEAGSLSAAARKLNVSQPSLSEKIRVLEASLSTTLLHRSVVGVRPTQSGELFYHRAVMLLQGAAELERDMRSGSSEALDIAIGLPTTISLNLTVPLVRAIRQRFPAVHLKMVESMSGYLAEWLESGRLDLAILYNVTSSASFICEKVVVEDLYLVSRGRTAGLGPDIALSEACLLPLVLPGASHGLRRTIENHFGGEGHALVVSVEVESLVNLKALAMDGSYSTILPLAAVRQEIAEGKLTAQRLIAPPLRRDVVIARSRKVDLIGVRRHVHQITKNLVATLLATGAV